VPHVLAHTMPYEDDYAVSEMLKERYPAAILPPRFAGPSQAKSYIAGLDLLLGSRMHATIAAISSGTAVLPLGYSRKFNGLFGSLGYRWNSDLTAESNAAILEKFDAAMADLPTVRREAVAANAEAQKRLGNYTAFLERTIADLVAKNA
jgi:polysaccharide pyruvyl transferase WcaK-like protein